MLKAPCQYLRPFCCISRIRRVSASSSTFIKSKPFKPSTAACPDPPDNNVLTVHPPNYQTILYSTPARHYIQRSIVAVQTQQNCLCWGLRTIRAGWVQLKSVQETIYQKEIDTLQAFVLPVTPCTDGRHFLP